MAMIRERALELLEGGNLTATAIAKKLGVKRNSASHALARAYAAGEVRIVDYVRTGKDLAPVYGLGGGDDVERPGPLDPNDRSAAYRARHPERNRASSRAWRAQNLEHVLAKQAEYRARRRADATAGVFPVDESQSRHDDTLLSNARGAKEHDVVEQAIEYFEMSDLLPGVKHFACDRYKATLSIQSCAERWTLSNEGASDDRMRSCLKCPVGALHAGKSDVNMSPWKGSMMCARCGEGASRLVGRHLCLSHYNRQQEVLRGFNAKHTVPKMHPPLHRRSVSYLTNGVVKTKTIEYTIGLEEVMFSVLRDEVKTVKFGGINVHPALAALRANPDLDFSIPHDEIAPVTVVHDEQDVREQAALPIVTSPLADVVVPVSAVLDVVQPDPAADVEEDVVEHDVDPLEAVRRLLDGVPHTPAPSPSLSKRAAKRQRQAARRQVRVSNVTASLLRAVGALPPAPPVVVPVPQPSGYPATLMFGRTTFG